MNSLSKSLLLYILLIFLLQQRRSYFLFFEAIRQNWTLTLFRNLKSRDGFWRDSLYSSRNHLALSSTCLTGYTYPRQVKVLQAHGFRNYFYNFCFLWSALQNLWWRCWSGLCWRYQNHNSQVSYFHNRTVPTPYYIRQSGKDTEETQASRSRVPEEAYRIEKRINNYLLIINFIP